MLKKEKIIEETSHTVTMQEGGKAAQKNVQQTRHCTITKSIGSTQQPIRTHNSRQTNKQRTNKEKRRTKIFKEEDGEKKTRRIQAISKLERFNLNLTMRMKSENNELKINNQFEQL